MENETVTLMCVCAGSLLAAKAGVLAGRECTTHHEHIDDLMQMEPSATVHANRIFVEDGRVFTRAGVTAGLDLTLYVIGQQLGHQVAAAVARDLVVYMRRSAAIRSSRRGSCIAITSTRCCIGCRMPSSRSPLRAGLPRASQPLRA
jgi:transcriptional regulator GlxA family with amidase domain